MIEKATPSYYSRLVTSFVSLIALIICACSLPPESRDGFNFKPGFFDIKDYNLAHKSTKSLYLSRFERHEDAIAELQDVVQELGYTFTPGTIQTFCQEKTPVPPRYNLGYAYFKNGDTLEALTIFADIVCENPNNFPARIALSLAVFECEYWCKLKLEKDAQKKIATLLGISEPINSSSSLKLIAIAGVKELADFSSSLSLPEVTEPVSKILTTLYAQVCETNKSLYYASNAAAIVPSDDNELYLAKMLMASGYYSEVISRFRESERLSAEIYRLLGVSYLATGECVKGLSFLNLAYQAHYPDYDLGRMIRFEFSNNYCLPAVEEFDEESEKELKWYLSKVEDNLIPMSIFREW